MRELPVLRPSRCTACGDCVTICPTHCLRPGPGGVQMPRPRDCIACGLCVRVCPEDALRLEAWTPA